MKIKSKPKKLKQKTENIDNNNKQEHHKINKIKKDFIKIVDKNEELSIKKKINRENKSCIKKLHYFAFLKLKKKYDCTPSKYDIYILEHLLNNMDCHLVSQFKENMITDYIEEFLRREYNYSESVQRIPKFPIYYKNYLHFFCKPTYNHFKFNKLIQNYGEKKAELYYKQNYQGGATYNEGDNGMEESSSEETSNKENEYAFNEDGNIFNKVIKEKLDNVTVMTTINSTGNNTINLNLNNEKIEVFSENKAEISNDTTIGDIMDDIKNELKKIQNKKNKSIKKKFKYSYRNISNYSLKSQDNYKYNKYHKNLSIEARNNGTSKDISKNLLLNKENNKKSKFKFSNDKINGKIKSQLFKYNIEAYKINKNRLNKISHEKIQKILKNRHSKNTFNNLYNSNYPYYNFSKDSKTNIRNISSNRKSTENRRPKRINISEFSERKGKYKSRNYKNSLYKPSIGGINTTIGKSSNINYQTTNNKKSSTNLIKDKDKTFKTMNFMKSAVHQRTNTQIVQNQKNSKHKYILNSYHKNKDYISNKKTSSLKLLVTESENPICTAKPSIKIRKNIKLKNKSMNNNVKNVNNKNKLINKNENNINYKITVKTNNYFNNLNNKKSKERNINIKKTFNNQNENLCSNNVLNRDNNNSSNMINNLNQLIYDNKESHTFRNNLNCNCNCNTKTNNDLMQIALSLLIENNSPMKKNTLTNKMNNNANILMKENTNEKDNKNSYFYINSPTHYNINISNHINININGKINGKINNSRGTKTNKNKSRKKININISSNKTKKNINQIKKQVQIKSSEKNKPTNNNNNIKTKIKTRNHKENIKNGKTQNINSSRNDNVSKGYKTKSVSNLEELINHNKKLIELYKGLSNTKEKK